MKYFYDTEFFERMVTPWFGKKRHQIDLISIGIVSEDGREYYAVSNEFDLDGAWKNEWLRENVLLQIYKELLAKRSLYEKTYHFDLSEPFSKKALRYLLKHHGKSRQRIANEITYFVWPVYPPYDSTIKGPTPVGTPFDLYGYYSAYDHVVLSSLFGAMIKLPKGFPMYTRDLKQMMDEKADGLTQVDLTMMIIPTDSQWRPLPGAEIQKSVMDISDYNRDARLRIIKAQDAYPNATNEHNAIADARWNKKLYEFLTDRT